jgi:gamma-glutamylputrescine oxidase
MLSYWEKESFVNYDHIIIGSGIVGLSTAISIKEKNKSLNILVLERGILPTGASTKNAGFACFGSLTELLSDIEILGKEKTLELVNERWQGLLKLRERVGDEGLDYHGYGGYELMREEELPYIDKIDEVNNMLLPLFNEPVFSRVDKEIDALGFDKKVIKSLIYNRFEGQLHTGKMMRSLLNIAQQLGIQIITGAEVVSFEDKETSVNVNVKSSVTKNEIVFTANKIAICTNAFTKTLIKDLDISPGRGIVMVTKPIKNLPFKGVFHIEKGYYYFRNEGDRVIFGGGRNLDYKGETTTSFEVNLKIEQELKRQLKEIILPNLDYEIDCSWAGIMAFGENKIPIYKQHSTNVWLGVRLGGMGVAIGSRMGEKLAEKML